MVTGPLLVGREPALAFLRTALAEAEDGLGRTVLLGGEPGIGKTALAAALANEAGASGWCVLWGHCWDGAGTAPFWPFVQVVRAASQGAGATLDLGEAARLVGQAGAPADDAEQARFLLFDAVVRVLADLSCEAPLVVVLDDLQWADAATLSLLDFAARHLQSSRVLLLGTYRDDEAGDRLQIAAGGQLLRLDGLSVDGVAELAAALGGEALPAGTAEELHRRTGGNPFFVAELVRLAVAGGARTGQPWAPASVRDAIERRLARLSQPCADLLALAAAAGPEVRLEIIARARPTTDDDTALSRLLHEAVAARVLAAPAEPFDPYRFAHDLYRETLLAGLAVAERGRLHQQVAAGLEAWRAQGAQVRPAELTAQHLAAFDAGVEDAADPAIETAVAAAETARAGLAFEDACAFYERALAAHDRRRDADPATRLALLLGLAAVRRDAGRGDARATAVGAAALARRLGDVEGVAQAALLVHWIGTRSQTTGDEATALLREAAAALDGATALRARVLAALARQLHHGADQTSGTEAAAVAAEAVAEARAAGDPATLAFALLARHDSGWRRGSAEQRLPIVEEMEAAAVVAGDADLAAQAVLLRATALLELGERRGVAELERYCAAAEALGHARGRYGAASRRATLAVLAGDLDAAVAATGAAFALGVRIGEPDALGVRGTQLAALGVAGWRGAEVTPLESAPYPALRPVIAALELLRSGRLDDAAAAVAGVSVADVPATHDLEALAYIATVVAAAGAHETREEVYEALRPYAGLHVVVGGCAAYVGVVEHHLGTLAAALGRVDEAGVHLRTAVAAHERLGATAWAAASRAALAALDGAARSGVPSAVPSAPAEGTFRREADVWTLAFDGVVAHLSDAKGLRDLAALLALPGRPVAAAQLYGGDIAVVSQGADAVLDDRARAAYKARLAELDAELDEAEAFNDPARAERARVERDALVEQLQAAFGLGGRARRLGEVGERARSAVSARIRDALSRIERAHPELGSHLRASVSTGRDCSYTPSSPTRWKL